MDERIKELIDYIKMLQVALDVGVKSPAIVP